MVLYFFPAAYTSGCDLKAHTFSTHGTQFTKAHAMILGLSENSLGMRNKFEIDPKFCASRFPIASNPSGSIGALNGVTQYPPMKRITTVQGQTITHGFFARTTFVVSRNGTMVAAMSSPKDHISPVQHVTRALAIVQNLEFHKVN